VVIRLTVRMRQLGARCRQWRPQHGSTLCRQSQSNDRVAVGNSVKHAVGEIVGQNVDVRFNSSLPGGQGPKSCSTMASWPRCVIRYWAERRSIGRPPQVAALHEAIEG
jgi:hypothetical protein